MFSGNQEEYIHAIDEIRKVALLLGKQVERTIPEFTDHSVKHMDALWSVADQVLSPPEFGQVTPAEGFVLVSFYIHDLGMALAATPEGLEDVRQSEPYKAAYKRLLGESNGTTQKADLLAVRLADFGIYTLRSR